MAFGIDDAIAAGLQVINKFIPDPAEKARAEAELRGSLLAWDQGQMSVNQAEAQNASIFVAGWRPFIGWVCGGALAYQYVASPLVSWISATLGHPLPPAPSFDGMLWELMFGMLGFGGLRTLEKFKGVAR